MFKRLCNWFADHRRISRRIGRLNLIYASQRIIMATLAEITQKIDTLTASVDAQQTVLEGSAILIDGVVVSLNGFKTQVAALVAQVAALQEQINNPNLDAISTGLTNLEAELGQNATLLQANKSKLAEAVDNTEE